MSFPAHAHVPVCLLSQAGSHGREEKVRFQPCLKAEQVEGAVWMGTQDHLGSRINHKV